MINRPDDDGPLGRGAQSLREATTRGLPTLDDTGRSLAAAAARATRDSHEEGGVMKMLGSLRARPRTVTAALGCALAAGVLLWPVSYQRTVGHTVTLHVPATGLSQAEQLQLARRARQTLHAQGVKLQLVRHEGGGDELVLSASLPVRSGRQAEGMTQALVAGLHRDHVEATAEVTARTELTAARVYAMALDKIISIRVDPAGKTDAEVADEIRNQLESGGIHGPAVTFERSGGESRMNIAADVDGRHLEVHRNTKDGDGAIAVDVGGIDDTRDPGMTDDQLRDKILRQLRARGLDATVTVTGDRIEIRAHKTAD